MPGIGQVYLNEATLKLVRPSDSVFLLKKKTIKEKRSNAKGYFISNTYYYFNGDGSLAKKDIYINGKTYLTQIFLTDSGKMIRVIEYQYPGRQRIKLDEKYTYNNKGQLVLIEKYNLNGLWLQRRLYPLKVLQSKLFYNNDGKIKKIITYKLNKLKLQIDEETTPDEIHKFSDPRPEIKKILDREVIEYEYDNGKLSKKTIKKGNTTNLVLIRAERWKRENGVVFHTSYIPGMKLRLDVKKESNQKQLIRQINWLYDNGQLIRMSKKTYDEKNGTLKSWQDKILRNGKIIQGHWKIKFKDLQIKENYYAEETKRKFPILAERYFGKQKDRVIQFNYDKSGNLAQRKIFQISTNQKQKPIMQLIQQEDYSYQPSRMFYAKPQEKKKP